MVKNAASTQSSFIPLAIYTRTLAVCLRSTQAGGRSRAVTGAAVATVAMLGVGDGERLMTREW